MRAAIAVYVLLGVGEVSWAAFVPLGPVFEDSLDLSGLEVGILLGSAGVAILLVSAPSGMLADRLGARRLTIAGTLLMAAGTIAQGLAPEFWSLLAARLLFGVGFGVIWSAGLALLSTIVPAARRTGALAFSMTVAGTGMMIGPGIAGSLAGIDIALPFLLFGAVTVLACVALVLTTSSDRPAAREDHEHTPVRKTLRAIRAEPVILGALACSALPGFANNAVNLLAPLELHDDGVSTAAIGGVLSIAALIFVLGSAYVSRHGGRLVALSFGAVGAALLAAVHVLPLISMSVASLVALLILRAPANAILFPIAVPIAVQGAERAGIGRGAALGVLNTTWAAAAMLGPIVAGVVIDVSSTTVAYAGIVALSAVTAVWLAAVGRRTAVRVD